MPPRFFASTIVSTAQEAVDFLTTVFQASTAYAIIGTGLDGTILLWNEGARRLYGYEPYEVVGRADATILHTSVDVASDESQESRDIALRDGKWEGTLQRVRKNGAQFPTRVILTPRRDSTGQVVGFLLISHDVSELLQRYTADLETLHKELEAFSYSVSHDLRAPLRIIDGFCSILIEDYASQLDPDAQDYLQAVLRNTQKMGQLIDALLHFSHFGRQPLTKCWVSPTAIVRQALSDLRSTHAGRPVEVSVAELPSCVADPALLTQLFIHLLSNALKYTRKRAVARIEVGAQDNTACPSAPIYFVKDNGVGFDMQYADKLFGVFQRLHQVEEYEGIGVGLAIVQRIVYRHGGRIWADAEVDRGATIYFTLGGGSRHAG